jgi:hypothetical protein
MATDPTQTFSDVALALQADPDDDVAVEGTRLLVKGKPFAFVDGAHLVVDLPANRAADLVVRGIATVVPDETTASATAPQGAWVGIDDAENWLELATEAHQFVGEPPVGRQS